MSTTSPTSIKLPSMLKKRIESLAEIRSKSSHSIMLQALENFVEHEEKREQLRQDAIKAHDNYMLTGLHATNDEVTSWLEELSQGKNTEPPTCHL